MTIVTARQVSIGFFAMPLGQGSIHRLAPELRLPNKTQIKEIPYRKADGSRSIGCSSLPGPRYNTFLVRLEVKMSASGVDGERLCYG